jgi:eukaryotic-like serine/threonine-protein kinase
VDTSELLHPGDVLDDVYEIQAKLGEGGMGQVFDAFDRRLFRHVAIKVARPGTSVSREAKALAALGGHPSIVTVHALGLHQGLEYAVMSRIGGVTLQRYLEQRFADGQALSIPEVLQIGTALAEALAFVHEAGMAHRDVKPANVILAPRDRVVLTDFGIFRPECDHSSSPLVWGTPEYMAPEQTCSEIAPGELFLVDVYALGIVLFEMLTGAVPFVGPGARVMAMHSSEPVPDPSHRRLDTPRWLSGLVGEMLSKSPSARPQGMREVAWQLRNPRPLRAWRADQHL